MSNSLWILFYIALGYFNAAQAGRRSGERKFGWAGIYAFAAACCVVGLSKHWS